MMEAKCRYYRAISTLKTSSLMVLTDFRLGPTALFALPHTWPAVIFRNTVKAKTQSGSDSAEMDTAV